MKTETGAAVLIVADHGPGISPEHLSHVFDWFYRVDSARISAHGRSGVGQAISKAITIAPCGSIDAASKTGAGGVFTMRLPMI